jgi:methionyl-tRNA formyltransferase
MRIDAGLDTGDILLQQELPITPADTAETLAPRLASIGADLVVETLRGLEGRTLPPRPQDNTRASLAPILKKEDGRIDFSRSAADIINRIRGFQPWPGAYTKFRGKTLQILKAQPAARAVPIGELHVLSNRLLVGCGHNTALELLEIQLEGKKRSSAQDFLRGYRPIPGEKLG